MILLLSYARRYIWPYRAWYAGGVVMLAITNWIAVTIPLYLAHAIDALWAGPGAREAILRDALAIALLGLVVIGVRSTSRVLFFTPGRLVEAEVKEEMFERLLRQQPPFLRNWPTGDLVSRASSDVNFVRLLAGFGMLGLFNTTLAASFTTIQMVRLSPSLALWILGPIAVAMIFTRLFVRRMFRLVHKMQDELASLSDHVLSTYQGVATVHGFVAEERFLERFDEKNDRYTLTSMQRAEMRAAIAPTLGFAASLNVFLLLFIGGPMAIRGEISVGELVAFTSLVAYLSGPLRSISFLVSIVKQAQAALERVDEVMAPPPVRPDLPEPSPAPADPPTLTLRNLTFSYPGSEDRAVLRDLSFSVPAGSTLGILGPTGAGKTTLLRCLARLDNPPRGTVFVDDVDLLDIDLDEWRTKMVYVPQRAFLFSESLRDNVLLGLPDDGRLGRALSLAAMDVDVEALPQGVETPVGESGVMLSGGQRQRTALARGLVRDHTVLVLDDVLSAVDHATEHQLITSLRAADRAPTTLIVSHRISALQHADQIAVIDGGELVDFGTHDELMTRTGFYRSTWERQAEGDEE